MEMQFYSFVPLLPHLYIHAHTHAQPHYKESQVYLARFKQYLSRALSFVKQHVVTTLKSTTRTIAPKQASA